MANKQSINLMHPCNLGVSCITKPETRWLLKFQQHHHMNFSAHPQSRLIDTDHMIKKETETVSQFFLNNYLYTSDDPFPKSYFKSAIFFHLSKQWSENLHILTLPKKKPE